MIWIILLVVTTVIEFLIHYNGYDCIAKDNKKWQEMFYDMKDDWQEGLNVSILIISVIFTALVLCGSINYLILKGYEQKIIAYRNNISRVVNLQSTTQEVTSEKTIFIDGRVNFIENYTKEVSRYNQLLVQSKIAKQSVMFNIFWDGTFISKKVLELDYIKE
jgi:hypothetical protein